jgi:hypothetical protein
MNSFFFYILTYLIIVANFANQISWMAYSAIKYMFVANDKI